MEDNKQLQKRTDLGRSWATAIVVLSIVIFFLPIIRSPDTGTGLIDWWSDESTPLGFLTYDSWDENGIQRSGQHVYEVASIASYTVLAILTILSFTGPLLLLYFNQVVDGIQSLLDSVFNCIRSCKDTGGKVPEQLDKICRETFTVLTQAQKVGALLKPVFNTIVAIALLLLVSSLLAQGFLVRSVFLYVFMTRCFNVSVFLGINSIIAVWVLARERYSSDRIKLLVGMDQYLRAELADFRTQDASYRYVAPGHAVTRMEPRNESLDKSNKTSSLRKEVHQRSWLKEFLLFSVGTLWIYRLFKRGQAGQQKNAKEVDSNNE